MYMRLNKDECTGKHVVNTTKIHGRKQSPDTGIEPGTSDMSRESVLPLHRGRRTLFSNCIFVVLTKMNEHGIQQGKYNKDTIENLSALTRESNPRLIPDHARTSRATFTPPEHTICVHSCIILLYSNTQA